MPIDFTETRGGALPWDGYLLFEFRNGMTEEWAFAQDSSALSFDKIKTQLKVMQGSPDRANLIGTGFVEPNRSVTIEVPIFSKKGQTIQDQLLRLSSYIANPNNYKCSLYIKRGEQYWYAEVKPVQMGATKYKDVWTTSGVSLDIKMVDNFYKNNSEAIIDNLFIDKSVGEWKEEIQIETFVNTQCVFQWILENPLGERQDILQCRFYKAGGYGIYLKCPVEERDITMSYDGKLFFVNGRGVIPTSGLAPELENGSNEIYIRSNFATKKMKITYQALAVW